MPVRTTKGVDLSEYVTPDGNQLDEVPYGNASDGDLCVFCGEPLGPLHIQFQTPIGYEIALHPSCATESQLALAASVVDFERVAGQAISCPKVGKEPQLDRRIDSLPFAVRPMRATDRPPFGSREAEQAAARRTRGGRYRGSASHFAEMLALLLSNAYGVGVAPPGYTAEDLGFTARESPGPAPRRPNDPNAGKPDPRGNRKTRRRTLFDGMGTGDLRGWGE